MLRRGRTYSLPGFLRPQCGKLLPALFFMQAAQIKWFIIHAQNNDMSASSHYPGFDYPANQIFKFLSALDYFTIMLKDGQIVHYTAPDVNAFRQWLTDNNIPDMRTEDGWVVNRNS